MPSCRRMAASLTTLATLLLLSIAQTRGQTLIENNGRALDAPGAFNDSNQLNTNALTNPTASSALGLAPASPFDVGSLAVPNLLSGPQFPNLSLPFTSTLNVNPLLADPIGLGNLDLQTGFIDATLFAPSFNVSNQLSLSLPTSSFGTGGFGTSGVSSAFDGISGVTPFVTLSQPGSLSLDISGSNIDPSNQVLRNLAARANGPDELITDLLYDEQEIIQASPIFGPMTTRLDSVRSFDPTANNLARALTSTGLRAANFGLTPWSGVSGVAAMPDRALPRPELFDPLADANLEPVIPGGMNMVSKLPTAGIETNSSQEIVPGLIQPAATENLLNMLRETTASRHEGQLGDPTDGPDPSKWLQRMKSGRVRPSPPTVASDIANFVPTGESVYRDMSEAIRWVKSLRGDRKSLMAGSRGVPTMNESYERALSFVRPSDGTHIASLAGSGEKYAQLAESQLKNGDFYAAQATYNVALVIDGNNPLLHLGQGHALIGAGEYYSAVRRITRGIDKFPEIAYFPLDLNEFITDPNVLDIRRADLETRLADREDYLYRFLLGYIEYFTGLEEFGRENLKTASQNAPPGSTIARFADVIEERDALLGAAPAPTSQP